MRNWHKWEEFIHEVESTTQSMGLQAGEEIFYRGHADGSWTLQPTLMRKALDPHELRVLEVDLFFEFQARARELHQQNLTDWDILFYMRHHGLPTRLLDWTESLGVALFFALKSDDVPKDPCIWLLNPYALNAQTLSDRDLMTPRNLGYDEGDDYYYDYGELLLEENGFDWELPISLYPQQKSARMGAQRGWFTIHGTETGSLEVLCPDVAKRIPLHPDAVDIAKQFLDLMGIDRYLLFQDLDGLSSALLEKYKLDASRPPSTRMGRSLERRRRIPSQKRQDSNKKPRK